MTSDGTSDDHISDDHISDDTYEVLAVRYGTRQTLRSDVYLNYEFYGIDDGPIGMDYFFWVVRNAQRTVLVDCGFDPVVGARRRRETLVPPLEALALLGVEQVDHLVVTHAHYDHIGNLRHFTRPEIAISRNEYEFWTGPLGKRLQFAASTEREELDALRAAVGRDQVTLVGREHALAPGIDLVELGGHAPGQLIARVRTASGEVILASDAVHYYEELELDRPFHVVADLAAMYRGFDLLRELEQAPGTVLVAGHDPEVMDRFPAYGGVPGGVAVVLS